MMTREERQSMIAEEIEASSGGSPFIHNTDVCYKIGF